MPLLLSYPRLLAAGLLTLLLGPAALAASAQANLPPVAYTGPRYPGGPDSLRVALQRLAATPDAPVAGEFFIKLELDKAGRLRNATPLYSPRTPAAGHLTKKQTQALDAALARWPAWQLTAGQPATGAPTVILPIAFNPAASLPALAYSDQEPGFAARSLGQDARQPVGIEQLLSFLQRQVRYPAEALRRQEQGRVYAYFEISETGAVEQQRVVGSAGPTLDAEVGRVLRLIPPALSPPRQQGRPVRVFYVQPITFSVK